MTKPTQSQAVLNRLKQGPATSWQLQQLGICCHTRRIFELRKIGHKIEATDTWQGRKRIVTYRLELPQQPTLLGIDASVERTGANEPIFRLCAECDRPFVPSNRARPLFAGEKSFCSDAHRAAFHRRHKGQAA